MVEKVRIERSRVAKNLIRGNTCNTCKHYHYTLQAWGVPTRGGMKIETKGVTKDLANKYADKYYYKRKEKEYCGRGARKLLGNLVARALPDIRTCEKWTEQG